MLSFSEARFNEASTNSAMLHNDMKTNSTVSRRKRISFDENPELVQRRFDRELREGLKSSHGGTAEVYDQFYRDHQLLLKLFVFLGVMPVRRSAPGVFSFKWKSPQMTYAFFFYIFTTTLVLRVGYERLKIIKTTEEFDEYIYAIIFVIFLVPHFWIPYVGWGVANRVAHYKTMWGAFQVRFYRVTGSTLTFPRLNTLILLLFIGCVLLSLIFLYSLSQMLDGFLLWHTTAYFHVITMINMNAALFYINSRAIKAASNSLSKCFKEDMDMECTPKIISQYRFLWLNLSELLQTLGSAYTRTYSTYYLFMAINITIGAYGSISEIFDTGVSYKVMGLLVLTIYCASLLFIICDCAHSATSVVAEGVQSALLTMDLLKVEKQAKREIDHFISAIAINPPVVSIGGYGSINRELLTGIATKIAIYLIVLLQFKMTFVEKKTHKTSIADNNSEHR